MAEDPTEKAPSVAGLLWAWAVRALGKENTVTLALGLIFLGLGGVGVVYAQSAAGGYIKEHIDAGIHDQVQQLKASDVEMKSKVDALAEDVRAVKEAQAAAARSAADVEQRNADRFDVLYRVVLTGQPSRKAEELARPAPTMDGGR